MAFLFTIAGCLCSYGAFFKDMQIKTPLILAIASLLFFMGSTIVLLLVAILEYIHKPTING